MENNSRNIKCNQCNEFISFHKVENVGKCLRDSMYKDSKQGNCQFGSLKKDKIN